jgi:hypothetical protein
MLDRKFPICSTPIPECIGREVLLARMSSALTKPTPDHLQVIGPRFAGKTVLLTELVRRIQTAGKPYTAVLLWDLAHQSLESDSQFIYAFGRELARALRANHATYADHIEAGSEGSVGEIAEVLDALKDDGGKVLVVLDGFDKAVANGCFTRNLWDQLRELAIKPSIRLVTASRKRLSELIRDPNAETSPFWNIFEPTPIRLGCFDEQDLNGLLDRIPEFRLTPGARTELLNVTNASPLLTLEVLNALVDGAAGDISAEAMLAACQVAFTAVHDRLGIQWADCTPPTQELFRRLREVASVSRGEAPTGDAEALIERGFVQLAGNKLQRPNRMLAQLLDETPNEGSSLSRLFSELPSYQSNLPGVFEHHIAHIVGLDPTLARYLKHGVDDLPDHPEVFLTHIRGFVDKGFDLIWKTEVPDKRIPSEWMSIWKRNGERRLEEWETTFPQGIHRVRLLNLMTGSDKSAPCAKHVSKGTYVLMNAAHVFGDFGQHQEGASIDVGTAYAALHVCVELAAALTRELPRR